MEEDVEIEMLLKANEDILQQDFTNINEEDDSLINDIPTEGVNESELAEISKELINSKSLGAENSDKEKVNGLLDQGMHSIKDGDLNLKNSETTQDYSNEIQELLDDHMVSYMAGVPSKHVLSLDSMESNDESTSSEDMSDEDDCDYFINEIMADDEPKYRGRFVEQLRKQVGNKSKQQYQNKTINELVALQKFILERHDFLTLFENKMQQELRDIEDEKKQIQYKMSKITDPGNVVREPSYTRCFFKKFGMPYFEDHQGFTHPPNQDHKRKIERGELIVSAIPRAHYWTKKHKDMLTDGIRQTIIDERSEILTKEITKLKGNISYLPNEEDNFIAGKIAKLQDDLRFLRSKSYLELVSKEPPDREYDWLKYSATVFNGIHSSDECRGLWNVYLKPTINKGSWEVGEDLKLLEIAQQMQYQDWDAIAKLLGTNRTAYQCMVHFQTRIDPKHDYATGKWTQEEDEHLMYLINSSRIGNFIPWTKVSSHMGNRTHNQIYNRWKNSLNPDLVKGKFTKEEDRLILSGIEVFKATYKEMSTLMTNRTPNQIRERYERHILQSKSKIGTWSLKEDEQLLKLIKTYGHNWSTIASELKTRTRTQARQRYNFIYKMQKNKPGWTIYKVKRRHIHKRNKSIEKTKVHVKKTREEINKVEKTFNLTMLEKETFRMEKLKELKDKIMRKKEGPKRKKKIFSDSAEVNNQLLEFFKPSLVGSLVKTNKIYEPEECNVQLNGLLSQAKYFGHELELPEFEDEIKDNPRLNASLKHVLLESVKNKVDSQVNNDMPSVSSLDSEIPSLDYKRPENDDTTLMKKEWCIPPIDISKLNFSELFKRTVFDYSYGMHKDIWEKMSRSYTSATCTTTPVSEVTETPQQELIPPNLLNTLGMRSILLSRGRLKKDATEEGFSGNLYQRPVNNVTYLKSDVDLSEKYLNQFLDTMVTLFTWPRVLSVTSIGLTQFPSKNIQGLNKYIQDPKKSNLGPKKHANNISKLLEISNNKSPDHEKSSMSLNVSIPKKEKVENKRVRAYIEKNVDDKHETSAYRKGIKCKRKMKIEHLVENIETDKSKKNSKLSSTIPFSNTRKSKRISMKNKFKISATSTAVNASAYKDVSKPSTSKTTAQIDTEKNCSIINKVPVNVCKAQTPYRKGNKNILRESEGGNPSSKLFTRRTRRSATMILRNKLEGKIDKGTFTVNTDSYDNNKEVSISSPIDETDAKENCLVITPLHLQTGLTTYVARPKRKRKENMLKETEKNYWSEIQRKSQESVIVESRMKDKFEEINQLQDGDNVESCLTVPHSMSLFDKTV